MDKLSNQKTKIEWIFFFKVDIAICFLQETNFNSKDTNRLKVMEKNSYK